MANEKFRVLVVDDDKDILELIYMTLSPDYEVLTLSESVDAIEIAEFFEPDIVILDIMLPKVTGYQILEYLRNHPKLGKVLAIFLSAKDTSYDIKYGYKLGANLYLTKPFQPERLAKNMQMLLTQSSGRPMRKMYSMRDVALRMKVKLGHYISPNSQEEWDPAIESESPAKPHRLRRPLGQEYEEIQEKKWVG